MRSDKMSLKVLRKLVDVIVYLLCIFYRSWQSEELCNDWKKATPHPSLRKARRTIWRATSSSTWRRSLEKLWIKSTWKPCPGTHEEQDCGREQRSGNYREQIISDQFVCLLWWDSWLPSEGERSGCCTRWLEQGPWCDLAQNTYSQIGEVWTG